MSRTIEQVQRPRAFRPRRHDGGISRCSRAIVAASTWVAMISIAMVAPVVLAESALDEAAPDVVDERPRPGSSASLAEIEACVSRNLPDRAGVLGFSVEAVDRTGVATASRAEMRWRKDEDALSQVMLRVREPAKTAGTAMLIVDREAGQPDFYLRLPEIEKVRRVRSKRLRGPVLGTDFSFEDLARLKDPVDKAALELVGLSEVEGRATWLLETLPDPEDGSEYARVLTYVDQEDCLPIKIDLYGEDGELRKRLRAPVEEIRSVGTKRGHSRLPHVFIMEDLRRETHTIIRVERFESSEDLPEAQFTKHALEEAPPAAVAR